MNALADATLLPPLRAAGAPALTPARRARRFVQRGTRAALRAAGSGLVQMRAAWLRAWARGALARFPRPWRLCLGSGAAPIPGWINVDRDGFPDVRLDLQGPLPWPDRSVALIYSEHFLEHVPLEAAQRLLRECRRVLQPGGVLRIATPDLAALVHAYSGDWRAQDWVRWPVHAFLDSPARMLNLAFHGWGHCYLWDEAELELRLRAAGFAAVRRCPLGSSTTPELRGLETRADSRLVVEACAEAAAPADGECVRTPAGSADRPPQTAAPAAAAATGSAIP